MTPSPFLLQLAILLLPGVIWAHLDAKFAARRKPAEVVFLLRALIFGLVSYAATYGVYWAFHIPFELVDLSEAESSNVITEAIALQIAVACAVGFFLAILWMYGVSYKVLTRFLQKINATNSFGDEDVWDFAFNSKDAASEYVFVRDFENKIVYSGWVSAYSPTDKLRELLLRDVEVLDFTGDLLFHTPRVYLARKTEGIHIEFPYLTPEEIADGRKR